ncbi:MAG: NADP-dependent oxidoreductase [Candidatus Acidiferrum sp.]
MKAARIHKFGPPNVIVIDELPRPTPGNGELIVRVKAAGVGPWDALIREQKSVVKLPLPLILGSDLSGMVDEVGPGVSDFKVGDEVYGVTNPDICGAYAEYAVASASMVARKPNALNHVEAASVPVIAVTAWQMLFDNAAARSGQTVLVHGGAGNVGAYAVQLANQAGLHVIATAASRDAAYVRTLGAELVLDYKSARFEDKVSGVDIVVDTVGGETRERSINVLRPGGILVSVVSPFPESPKPTGIRTAFFIVEVTTGRLNTLRDLFDRGKLSARVGSALPLEQARSAHEMLGGAPHKRGKIVLRVAVEE